MNHPPEKKAQIAAIVLAAGGSRRLGQAKQLLRHQGQSLVERTIHAALTAGAAPVLVVLGAGATAIRQELPPFPDTVRFIHHEGWAEGMGTSIACGARALPDITPLVDAVLILVCDQPALHAGLLRQFTALHPSMPEKILVSDYGTDRGPPVLFPRSFFGELAVLADDTGARGILRANAALVQPVAFPQGDADIDTAADLGSLQP